MFDRCVCMRPQPVFCPEGRPCRWPMHFVVFMFHQLVFYIFTNLSL